MVVVQSDRDENHGEGGDDDDDNDHDDDEGSDDDDGEGENVDDDGRLLNNNVRRRLLWKMSTVDRAPHGRQPQVSVP